MAAVSFYQPLSLKNGLVSNGFSRKNSLLRKETGGGRLNNHLQE